MAVFECFVCVGDKYWAGECAADDLIKGTVPFALIIPAVSDVARFVCAMKIVFVSFRLFSFLYKYCSGRTWCCTVQKVEKLAEKIQQ